MQKLFTASIIFFSCSVFSSAYAQNIYGSSTTSGNNTSSSSQVMTSEQFKNRVNTLGKQTKNSISQQVDEKFKGGTAVKTPPLPTPLPSDDTNADNNQATPAAMAPGTVSPAPVTPQPATAANSTAPAPSSAQTSNPAASSSQPYSGFGTGQTNQKTAPSGGSNKSGGNWNVGY